MAIGTSLPELFVNVDIAHENELELTIGNILGSCIFDACFSIGISPLIFPISFSGNLLIITKAYALLVSIVLY